MSERGDVWPKAACGHSLAHVHWDGCWKCEFERRHGSQDELTAAERRIKELEAELANEAREAEGWFNAYRAARVERTALLAVAEAAGRMVFAPCVECGGTSYEQCTSYGYGRKCCPDCRHTDMTWANAVRAALDVLKIEPSASGSPGPSPASVCTSPPAEGLDAGTTSISDSAAQHEPLNGPHKFKRPAASPPECGVEGCKRDGLHAHYYSTIAAPPREPKEAPTRDITCDSCDAAGNYAAMKDHYCLEPAASPQVEGAMDKVLAAMPSTSAAGKMRDLEVLLAETFVPREKLEALVERWRSDARLNGVALEFPNVIFPAERLSGLKYAFEQCADDVSRLLGGGE